jgi:uncharacterized membrane protein YcaP (DUF421 family)
MLSSDFWERAAGLAEGAKALGAGEMAVRALLVYVLVVIIVRLGKKRFLGRATAFDVIIGIMLGSIAGRAITGNAPLWPSIAACAVLMALHWIFSGMALRSHAFGSFIKGGTRTLIRDGRVDGQALRREHMTERDLEEALREHGLTVPDGVAEARLERDGSVSVIKAEAGS